MSASTQETNKKRGDHFNKEMARAVFKDAKTSEVLKVHSDENSFPSQSFLFFSPPSQSFLD